MNTAKPHRLLGLGDGVKVSVVLPEDSGPKILDDPAARG